MADGVIWTSKSSVAMYRSRVVGDVGVGLGDGPDVVDAAVVDGSVDAVAGGVALQAVATKRIVSMPSRFGFTPRVSSARGNAASDMRRLTATRGTLPRRLLLCGDDDLGASLTGTDVAHRLASLGERIGPIDHRAQLARLHEVPQVHEILGDGLRDVELHALA